MRIWRAKIWEICLLYVVTDNVKYHVTLILLQIEHMMFVNTTKSALIKILARVVQLIVK